MESGSSGYQRGSSGRRRCAVGGSACKNFAVPNSIAFCISMCSPPDIITAQARPTCQELNRQYTDSSVSAAGQPAQYKWRRTWEPCPSPVAMTFFETQEWNEIQFNGVFYSPPLGPGEPGVLDAEHSYTFKYPRPDRCLCLASLCRATRGSCLVLTLHMFTARGADS